MIKIVIADDEKTIRNGMKKMLENSGLPLTIGPLAANGPEAKKVIEEFLPDIVLMDINMPGMKGLDVIEEMMPLIPNAKIIIISGYDDFKYARRAIQLGTFDYLLKPLNRNNLVEVLKRAIFQLDTPSISENKNNETYIHVESNNSIADKAIDYINANYKDSAINLSYLSKQLHVSESYLTRIIKNKINKSFSAYLTELRMTEAKKLLLSRDDLMVWQIAEIVGYSSHHYFCRVFKTYVGLSPIEYKNS